MIEVWTALNYSQLITLFQDPNRKNKHLVQLFGFYLPAAGMTDTANRIRLRFKCKNGLL